MEANTGLAEALKELHRVSTLAAGVVKLEVLKVDDGRGGKAEVPVAILPTAHGGFTALPLLDAVKGGLMLATQQRLAIAEGPDRRQGTAQLQSLDSFIHHANRFKAENSAVWANAEERQLVSVLDYHPEGPNSKPRWGTHRGTYECPLSEAWRAWGGGNALGLDQDGFAALLDSRDRELIEGNLPSGKSPSPATLITLAANLEAYSHAVVKRERDTNTGRVKLSYTEDKGVNGSVMPPPAFLVRIPVFQDGTPLELEVRLRVTVDGTPPKARFTVQIHAAGDVLRDAFQGLCDRVDGETELPVFVGTPEI